MAQDDVLYFDELPYCAVPVSEMRKDFGLPTMTKADYINNDFLDDLKKLYHGDLFKNLNFDYFTADTFVTLLPRCRQCSNSVAFTSRY